MGDRGKLGAKDHGFVGIYAITLTADDGVRLGRAFGGSVTAGRREGGGGPARIALGFDLRPGSWELQNAVVRGLASEGVSVIHVGNAGAALVLFAAARLKLDGAVVVGGGPRPAHWNGVRFYREGRPLGADEIGALRCRAFDMSSRDILPFSGEVTYLNLAPDYLRAMEQEFEETTRSLRRRPLRVAVATLPGTASLVAPHALRRVGCRVVRIGRESLGGDRGEMTGLSEGVLLRRLGEGVRRSGAEVGFVLDGDGARLHVLDSDGGPAPPDFIAALIVRGLPHAPVVAADIRSGDLIEKPVSDRRGRLEWSGPGESSLEEKLRGTGAVFAAGADGLCLFADRGAPRPDGIYTALRLIESFTRIRDREGRDLRLREALPGSERFRAPERVIQGRGSRTILHRFREILEIEEWQPRSVVHVPGAAVRVRFDDSWGVLYRAPETADLHLRFEARTEEAFHRTGDFLRDVLERARETAVPAPA
ncbi:MAG: hypothetical protein ABIK65_06460 [Candidatus Eisenbacteria bacterium]